jgi:hypothetical protein
MDCICSRCGFDAAVLSNNSVKKTMRLVISGTATKPEDILFVRGVPVVASETKRAQYSTLFCLPQALAGGADVARLLRNRGLVDPGVPVVLLAGDVVQFAGVFLIADDFPVFCLLSRPFLPSGPAPPLGVGGRRRRPRGRNECRCRCPRGIAGSNERARAERGRALLQARAGIHTGPGATGDGAPRDAQHHDEGVQAAPRRRGRATARALPVGSGSDDYCRQRGQPCLQRRLGLCHAAGLSAVGAPADARAGV